MEDMPCREKIGTSYFGRIPKLSLLRPSYTDESIHTGLPGNSLNNSKPIEIIVKKNNFDLLNNFLGYVFANTIFIDI